MDIKIILFIVIVLLVTGDKLTTYYSIRNLQKNYPQVNAIDAEKNPLAKFFFQKFGLIWGNVLYGIISVITAYLFLFFMQMCLKGFGVGNYIGISWYIFILWYFFVIANNTYFVLKHGKILP